MSTTTEQVKERPILFSAPMVRALLAGTKTQTRRIVKGLGVFVDTEETMGPPTFEDGDWIWPDGTTTRCPYGVPGERLWVKEAYSRCGCLACANAWPLQGPHGICDYREGYIGHSGPAWVSPIFMPRWASRITLEITDVRVERVQAISEADAMAEGMDGRYAKHLNGQIVRCSEHTGETPVEQFVRLWQSINGPESWAESPWVWAVSFKVLSPAPVAARPEGG